MQHFASAGLRRAPGVTPRLVSTSKHDHVWQARRSSEHQMGILSEIFAWWTGNTWGTRFTIWKHGRFVGTDELGNRYFEQKNGIGPQGRPRRWVVYKSSSEPTLIPPSWHGWMHYTHDDPPTGETYVARPWEKPHLPNMTGTPEAYRPAGSILTAAERPPATGDYKPWQPG